MADMLPDSVAMGSHDPLLLMIFMELSVLAASQHGHPCTPMKYTAMDASTKQ